MAKQKFEITGFTNGVIGSVSETDIPKDAASFSKNIDAISEDGALRGVKEDTVASSGSGFQTSTKHKQTLTVNYGTNNESSIAVDSITNNNGTAEITTSSSHGLVDGDIIRFYGTTGTAV